MVKLISIVSLVFVAGCSAITSKCPPNRNYSVIQNGKQLYPSDAYRDGIEGEVLVRFDINANGETENIQVLSETPEGIFSEHAARRVQTTLFNPRIENCEAVVAHGIEFKIDFNLSPNRPPIDSISK